MTSFTEENYLKAIFHLSENKNGESVSTNELAEATNTKAASVTDMLKRMAEKELINYKKYQGVNLTENGRKIALKIVRRHRLWEVFLVDKLGFKWDEIHEIAEELEHIESQSLTERLNTFLGNPSFDPHGDPIPNLDGIMPTQVSISLNKAPIGKMLELINVSEDSQSFLRHLDKHAISLGCKMEILEVSEYDKSIQLTLNGTQEISISNEVAQNLYVRKV